MVNYVGNVNFYQPSIHLRSNTLKNKRKANLLFSKQTKQVWGSRNEHHPFQTINFSFKCSGKRLSYPKGQLPQSPTQYDPLNKNIKWFPGNYPRVLIYPPGYEGEREREELRGK